MAERKTRPTTVSADGFIDSLDGEQVRADCRALVRMMQEATGCPPEMWGASIVGFGRYWWTGASGKAVEWMIVAFSPRKANLTIYLWPQFDGRQELLEKLGKHTCGKGCLYIKRLSDVHVPHVAGADRAIRRTRPRERSGSGARLTATTRGSAFA